MSILTQSDAFSKVFYDNDEVKGLKMQLTSSHTIATQTTNIYFDNLITSVPQEDHNNRNHNHNHNHICAAGGSCQTRQAAPGAKSIDRSEKASWAH